MSFEQAVVRLAAIALLSTCAIAPGAQAGKAQRLPCPPAGSHLIAGNGVIRVYSVQAGSRMAAQPAPAVRGPADTFACRVRNGTRMTLVRDRTAARWPRTRLGRVALSGAVVAYLERNFGVDAGCEGLRVADVSTRRILREVPLVGCSVDACLLRCERVAELVVDPHGSVAWTLELELPGHRFRQPDDTTRLYAAPLGGPIALLDEGAGLGATSLTLSHGNITWWHDGTERSAQLRP